MMGSQPGRRSRKSAISSHAAGPAAGPVASDDPRARFWSSPPPWKAAGDYPWQP